MDYTFIEVPNFMHRRDRYFGSDENFRQFQSELAADPRLGTIIPGCSPLRKVRWGDGLQGKRGALRIIYLQVPERRWIFLVHVYRKNEQADLTARERKLLGSLAEALRREAMKGY